MLIPILIVLTAILVVLIAFIATRPGTFSVTRTSTIAAPTSVVFAQVNDYHNWEKWSPWARLDPAAKTIHSGAAAGVGAKYAWAGNAKVGAGHMEITESHPYELIKMKLVFTKPMAGTNFTEFTFKPEGYETTMIWSMTGKLNFIAKAIHLLINCDKMIGGNFEQGMANLNEAIQANKQ